MYNTSITNSTQDKDLQNIVNNIKTHIEGKYFDRYIKEVELEYKQQNNNCINNYIKYKNNILLNINTQTKIITLNKNIKKDSIQELQKTGFNYYYPNAYSIINHILLHIESILQDTQYILHIDYEYICFTFKIAINLINSIILIKEHENISNDMREKSKAKVFCYYDENIYSEGKQINVSSIHFTADLLKENNLFTVLDRGNDKNCKYIYIYINKEYKEQIIINKINNKIITIITEIKLNIQLPKIPNLINKNKNENMYSYKYDDNILIIKSKLDANNFTFTEQETKEKQGLLDKNNQYEEIQSIENKNEDEKRQKPNKIFFIFILVCIAILIIMYFIQISKTDQY